MSPARGVVLTDLQSSLIVNNFSLSLSLSSVGTEEALLVVALLLLVVALLHKHEAHLVLPLCYRCVTAVFARLVFDRNILCECYVFPWRARGEGSPLVCIGLFFDEFVCETVFLILENRQPCVHREKEWERLSVREKVGKGGRERRGVQKRRGPPAFRTHSTWIPCVATHTHAPAHYVCL